MTTHSPTSSAHSVFTLGSFDGVHAGHQALVREARRLANAAGRPGQIRVLAQAFDPSPISVLHADAAPARISTYEQRCEWLIAAGADSVIKLEPSRELLTLSAADFVARKVSRYNPIAWVEGPDFRFGHRREGDVETLTRLGKQHGFDVKVVEPVSVTLDDHSIVPARSTIARWLLSQGRVRDAAHVLTRPHQLFGRVVPGDRRGRTIGYPTANLSTPCMIPADGVYAGIAELPDGRRCPAAISIGTKPTFGNCDRAVEAFLLDRESSGRLWSPLRGLPEYDWTLALDMISWIRDQVTFDGLPGLLAQIERDCNLVAELTTPYLNASPIGSPKIPQEAGA